MPIKRRKRPEPKKPVRKKITKHELTCRDLYNRLQTGNTMFGALDDISEVTSQSSDLGPVSLAMGLAARCTTSIHTLQINYPDNVSYRVVMEYTDRTKKPKHGYLYPTKIAVKSSPLIWKSIILAYIELCKNLGRWI